MTRREPLTRARVVRKALEMLDEGGEGGLTMRRLADALGVDPMAVYHHLPNKAAVVQEAVEAVLSACELPAPTGAWKGRVRAVCRAYRRLARAHPGAFPLVCAHRALVPGDRRVREALLAALSEAGLSDRDTVRAASAFLSYAAGFALGELTGTLRPATEPERAALRALQPPEYPATARLREALDPGDPDAEFEFGLDVLLAGTGARAASEG